MNAYLLDDEPLAITRLTRLLDESGRVTVVGSATTPREAVDAMARLRPDVLFLDIEMPVLSGFDVLERLDAPQPLVVFVTAYDHYAVRAFKVDSIDYLLKPVDARELSRTLDRLEQRLREQRPLIDMSTLVTQMRDALATRDAAARLERVASRIGERVELIDVQDVAYFYAKDKVTFAATAAKHHILDLGIADLERRLPAHHWVRIHRATLVHTGAVKEIRAWFGGKLLVRLKDGTELPVARERVAEVKAKLGA